MAMGRVPSWRSLLGGDRIDRPLYLSIYPVLARKTHHPRYGGNTRKRMPLVYVGLTWEEVVRGRQLGVRTPLGRLRAGSLWSPRAGEDPRGGSRPAQAQAAGRTQARPHARGAPARDQGPVGPSGVAEREAVLHPPRGARADRRPARRGREAHPATVRLRHVPGGQRR